MGTDLTSVIGSLDFKILVEFDEDYKLWVARCIDTNAVATADTADEAEVLIKQVLENDIRIAVEEGSIKNLVQSRSSFDAIERWYQLKTDSPENVRHEVLDVPDKEHNLKRSVQSELKIVSRRRDSSAA